MNIIVNADDLGSSREVNDAIFSLMRERRITSATILANGEAVEDASRRLLEFPQCSFGVHLNLSEYRPLTKGEGLRPILALDGSFNGNRLREVRINGPLRTALLAEWTAQVERLQRLGVRVSHFDSHHHMHTLPAMLPVLSQLRSRVGVRKARTTLNIFPPERPPSLAKRAGKRVWDFALRNWCRMRTTDGFTSFETFSRVPKDSLLRFRSIELMVHPGSRASAVETQMLRTDWLDRLTVPADLVSYNDL